MALTVTGSMPGIGAQGFKTLRLLGILALVTMALPLPARAQEDVRARLDQMENDIQTLNHAVYKGETPPPDSGAAAPSPSAVSSATLPSSDQAQADLQVRLGEIEKALATLTGRVEEQQHQAETFQQNMQDQFAKFDQRLAVLEHAQPAAATTTTPGSTPSLTAPDTAPPPVDAGSDTSKASSTLPVKPLGTLTQAGSDGLQANPNSPEDQYQQAYTQLKNQKYDQAESGFLAFLKKYPQHALAGNATYWLGETYYARGQFDKAAKSFAQAYQGYPQSPKAPDALLKMGLSLNGMGQKDSACLAYGQLKTQFPGSGAVLDRGQQESAKIGCK